MALKSIYVCTSCGYTNSKWYGRCPSCGEWNTFTEEVVDKKKAAAPAAVHSSARLQTINEIKLDTEIRYTTGISELDRVLGGGIVKGSVVLLGGEPGAGKSTLLLQVCGRVGDTAKVLYVSGEESPRQIKLRARRLGVASDNIYVVNETSIAAVVAAIERDKPDLVIIDSIQTMASDELNSSPGTVTQVRECSSQLLRCAKENEIPTFIVGHVNKDGAIAGPKVMEHIVDTVLYFEGDRFLPHRILRAVKNRFGSTNEIGIFEMTSEGLLSVTNPSAVMLEGVEEAAPGSCVTCVLEGSRPLLTEIQSLVTKTSFAVPRRTASGFDYNRINLLLAVLEKRGGITLSSLDVYINVVGGLTMNEPGADAAVLASIISAAYDKKPKKRTVFFGEVGLGGEIRPVQYPETRLAEVERLGFEVCVLPRGNLNKLHGSFGIELCGVSDVRQLMKVFSD